MSNSQITTIPSRPSALALMAERCSVDPSKLHATLKNTVFKGATDDELLALVVTANVYDLNPLLKEMYAFPKKGGGITPMVGIDGWLKIANRQPNFNGLDVDVFGDGKTPTHATCTLWLKDREHPVKITEYFDECKRSTDPWNQMPRRMLRNKAIIQTIRVAFGIGGIHDEDEEEDISRNSGTRHEKIRASIEFKTNPYIEAPEDVEVEAAEVIQEVESAPAATINGYFEGCKVIESKPDAKKPWKLWKVTYLCDGKVCEASTFSATLGELIGSLEEGTPIILEVTTGERGDTIEKIELPQSQQKEGGK